MPGLESEKIPQRRLNQVLVCFVFFLDRGI